MVPPFKGFGRPIHGFGIPDVQDAVPGSAKRRVVHVEGVVVGDTYVGEDTYQDITVRISLTFLRLD